MARLVAVRPQVAQAIVALVNVCSRLLAADSLFTEDAFRHSLITS